MCNLAGVQFIIILGMHITHFSMICVNQKFWIQGKSVFNSHKYHFIKHHHFWKNATFAEVIFKSLILEIMFLCFCINILTRHFNYFLRLVTTNDVFDSECLLQKPGRHQLIGFYNFIFYFCVSTNWRPLKNLTIILLGTHKS